MWVVSGDYKRAADPTCAPFEPVPCDTFITESTFGLPIYRWDPTRRRHRRDPGVVGRQPRRAAARRCSSATRSARRSGCWPSWRASPIARCSCTAMMLPMIEAYREAGVRDAADAASVIERPRGTRSPASWCWRRSRRAARRGCAGSATISDAFASGLMRVRGVRRQRAFDRGFVLSDHADWPALLHDHRRDRRRARARHARPRRAARALPARAGPRGRRHPHGLGRREPAAATDDALRRALRRHRPHDLDQRQGRRRWPATSPRRRRPMPPGRCSSSPAGG